MSKTPTDDNSVDAPKTMKRLSAAIKTRVSKQDTTDKRKTIRSSKSHAIAENPLFIKPTVTTLLDENADVHVDDESVSSKQSRRGGSLRLSFKRLSKPNAKQLKSKLHKKKSHGSKKDKSRREKHEAPNPMFDANNNLSAKPVKRPDPVVVSPPPLPKEEQIETIQKVKNAYRVQQSGSAPRRRRGGPPRKHVTTYYIGDEVVAKVKA